MNESISIVDSIQLIPLGADEVSPLMTKVKIKVFHLGENRNKSFIDKETAISMAKTLRGNPIVGRYKEEKQDFTDHGKVMTIDDDGVHFEIKTKPYGFVDLNAKVWFEDYMDTDENGNQVQHTYVVTEGRIWTEQYAELRDTIAETQGRPQSMELQEETLKGFWSNQINPNTEIFIINDAVITKLCALGDDTEPCFIGSSITPEFTKAIEDSGFMKELIELKHKFSQYTLNKDEGGNEMSKLDEKDELTSFEVQESTEEPQVQFEEGGDAGSDSGTDGAETDGSEVTETEPADPVTPNIPGTENPEESEEEEEKGEDEIPGSEWLNGEAIPADACNNEYPPVGESIEEAVSKDGSTNIPKSILENTCKEEEDKKDCSSEDKTDKSDSEKNDKDLEEEEEKKKEFSLISAELEELKVKFTALEEENAKLREFKQKVEDNQKDELIKSFYMLSDEDKKDVIANKAQYSLDDIKAKLSIICVDKRVDFSLGKTSEEEVEDSTMIATYNLHNHAQATVDDIPAWLKVVEDIRKQKEM